MRSEPTSDRPSAGRRRRLPDRPGLETDLIYHQGYDLSYFAAFVLLEDEAGVETLRRYFREHAAIARDAGVGCVLESATWRASPDWGDRLGYTREGLADLNRRAIDLLVDVNRGFEGAGRPVVISGRVGPRGDGYRPTELMTAEKAQQYQSTRSPRSRRPTPTS